MKPRVIRKVHRYTEYLCGICRHPFHRRALAEQCIRNSVEPQEFHIGQRVTRKSLTRCTTTREYFQVYGRVSAVIGPTFPYIMGPHSWKYRVAYTCDCGGKTTIEVFAKSLHPLSRSKHKKKGA